VLQKQQGSPCRNPLARQAPRSGAQTRHTGQPEGQHAASFNGLIILQNSRWGMDSFLSQAPSVQQYGVASTSAANACMQLCSRWR